MEDLMQTLHPNTLLCVATDITLPTEYIKTFRIADWKQNKVDLDKRPTLFILHKNA
jgi:16S rRNA (cytidine1402-2'-O)-methyltransferase